MVRIGIIGATGYSGREVLRLLCRHPDAQVTALTSESAAGARIDAVLPAFNKVCNLTLEAFDPARLADQCDVVFIGVPATKSMAYAAALRKAGVRVIDVGPDFRLRDPAVYRAHYGADHTAIDLLESTVYGLVPQNREALRTAQLVAGCGCYAISIILPLWPLVDAPLADIPVVVDAITGVSGAGRVPSEGYHFPEMNENLKAYKVASHRHTPEIEQALGHRLQVQFTPHVAPLTRGILSTLTVRPAGDVDLAQLYARYADEPFIRILGEGKTPEVQHVRASNFCDIGWVTDRRTGNIIIVSALDNLVGGTAGMAVQCMNVMFGLDETTGLEAAGLAP